MKRWRKGVTLALVALLSLGLFACGKKENTVKIGMAGPVTGDQAQIGNDVANGARLAVEEWNAKGGVLGKKIELMVADDKHDPKEAVTVANKLVTQGVVGVVGHVNSSCTLPASDVYKEKSIPQITPSSTNPEITDRGYRHVFRVCGRDDAQGKILAEFIVHILKKDQVAVLDDKTTYGKGLADATEKRLKELGVTPLVHESIVQGEKDYTPVLTSIRAQKPQAIFYGGIYAEGAQLVKQMKSLGMKVAFVSGDGIMQPDFLKNAGSAAEGAYASFGPSEEGRPAAEKFVKAYTPKYGKPGSYSIYAYDAANIILKGIEKANSTEPAKVTEAIHALTYEGAFGPIEFDQKGDVKVAPYVVWVVKEGKFVPYETAGAAKTAPTAKVEAKSKVKTRK